MIKESKKLIILYVLKMLEKDIYAVENLFATAINPLPTTPIKNCTITLSDAFNAHQDNWLGINGNEY